MMEAGRNRAARDARYGREVEHHRRWHVPDNPRVLVIGLDPARVPGWDPEPVLAAIARGHAGFADRGVQADLCLVAPDDSAEEAVVAALTRHAYACVVVGGGIRKHEPLLGLFERVVNLVRQYAPGAAIAFNSTPEDTVDAALRWLR